LPPDIFIILIAYHFPPENTIGALRPFRFFKYLKRLGYQCHVITASTQQAASEDITFVPDASRDFLEFGLRNGPLPLGIHVERILRRTLYPGHLGTTWSRRAVKACERILNDHKQQPAVVFSSYPPLGAHLAGLQLALKRKLPWMADFRDPMGLDPMLHLMPPLARRAITYTDSAVVRAAQCILLTVESAGETYARKYPLAKEKFHVIWNGFDPESEPRALPVRNQGHKVLIHTGSLYHGRNANVVVESIVRLRAKDSAVAKTLLLRLIGEATAFSGLNDALYQQGIEEGWLEMPNQWIAQPEALRMTQEADALLLLQPQSTIQVPGKLFEYLCIGRPILAVVPKESAVEWVLTRAGVPYVCLYPTDAADEIDRKLESFLQLPETPVRANDWFRTNFDAEQQTRRLAGLIDNLFVTNK
jgi:hypothetical protein